MSEVQELLHNVFLDMMHKISINIQYGNEMSPSLDSFVNRAC